MLKLKRRLGNSDKPDYRKALNTMLSLYYKKDGAFQISREIHHNGIHFKANDIMACINTLMDDGHIKDLAPGYSMIPLCAITGKGKVFHEQGGYQDDSTRFDKIVKWAKNNKFLAWILIVFVVVAALIGFVVSLIAIYEFFNK
ncbi:MAG: hypothetical protein RIC95_03145 [Vicingaceae bacterium]